MTAPDVLLRAVVALLPRKRRDWGRAMRAELAHIDDRSSRWSYAFSCLRATLSPKSPGGLVAIVASPASIAAAVVLTAGTGYAPLRWALIAYAVLLVAVVWAGGLLTWPPDDLYAAWLRVGGIALVAVFAAGVVAGFGSGGDPIERATSGVPILAAVSMCYLVAVIMVSAGHGPHTVAASAVAANAVRVGAIDGVAVGAVAGVLWTLSVLVFPPVPAGTSAALLTMVAAAGIAVARSRIRHTAPRAALAAVASCALVIIVAVGVIGSWAPERYVPLLPSGSGPLTQATLVAQSRSEMSDPYVAVLFLGALAALLLIAVVRTTPVQATTPAPVAQTATT